MVVLLIFSDKVMHYAVILCDIIYTKYQETGSPPEMTGFIQQLEVGREEYSKEVSQMSLKLCNCCKKGYVYSWATCPVCGWGDDRGADDNPDTPNLVQNKMSLNEARKAFKEGRKIY